MSRWWGIVVLVLGCGDSLACPDLPGYEVFVNTGTQGDPLTGFLPVTAGVCAELCDQSTECKAFVHRREDNQDVCMLKSGTEMNPNPGVCSYLRQ